MQRIGYDGSKYQFKDLDGSIWESADGDCYGTLTKVFDPSNPKPLAPTSNRIWLCQPDPQASLEVDKSDDKKHAEDAKPTRALLATSETEQMHGRKDERKAMAPLALLVWLATLIFVHVLSFGTETNVQ